MRIPLIAALAAATALVPVGAMAQDRQDHGDWHRGNGNGHDRGGDHAPGGNRPAAQPQAQHWGGNGPAAAARPQPTFRGGGDFQRPAPVDRGNFQRPDTPRAQVPDRGGWQGRSDRPNVRPVNAPRPQVNGGTADWHAQAGGSHWQDRGNQGQWQGRDGQRSPDRTPGQWQGRNGTQWQGRADANQWQNRQDDHRGDAQVRGNDRGWNGQDRNRRGEDRDGWRGDRGSYNRDWRRDDRYDWRDYRAQNRSVYHLPRYYAPYGWDYGYRRFSVGFRLGSVLFGSNYWISDPWAYRLPPAYGPYRWVRYYDDALLVDLRTGIVVDVVYDIFW
jgi:hypothetical protein